MSKLYVVGTPIGNLSDFSPRAVETLKSVDFIAAEDTRVTMKLLTHFGIQKPMISYHEHNIRSKGEEIIARIMEGESCAICTDAGMPCISDPGEDLVRLCALHGIETVVVPSPTAAMSALAVSGLSTSRFSFEGFLSVNKKQRSDHLEEIKNYHRTLIFYEAPHKLKYTLDDLLEVLGDRKIALCRELTKVHEEIIRGTISDMIRKYETESPRGEYVLIVEGAPYEEETAKAEITLEEAAEMAEKLVEEGRRASDACKEIAAKTRFSKSEIYKQLTVNS
ncbi:MAG: 16S rRNA (cytidine(1402)-2'-O)-methyltransferase [Ruminiclostridium sp.]